MRKAIHSLARLLDNVQRRFQRSRAGSVMILVVSLLVLMAIIGTAFLTTARNERYSSQLHESNVQVDMLLEGVKNIILGRMGGENFLDPNGQRWDDVHSDNWLASRTPTYMIDACGVWNQSRLYSRGDWVQVVTNAGSTPPAANFYVSIAENNIGYNPTSDTNHWMQDPQATPTTPCWEAISSLFDLVRGGVGVSAEDVRGSVVAGIPATFDGTRGRNLVQLVFNTASGPAGSLLANGQYYPALRFYRPGNPNDNPPTKDVFETVPAASASGNGIADSFLWRLPMGEINGVTYYAAVRVIDNNSAINLNTAGSSLYDFDAYGNPLPNMSFFPGDVGLAEILSTFNFSATNLPTLGQEFGNLNQYRDGTAAIPEGIIGALNPNNLAGPSAPVWDYQGSYGQRPDFRYLSLADAQFMGLGRRIDLPGRSTQSGTLFNNLSWGDSAALAYKFDLVSPATFQLANGTGGASMAETILAPSLWNQTYYRSTPWDPSPTNPPYTENWFLQNYAYTTNPNPINGDVIAQGSTFNISKTFNRRPLVVARNPQSNMMPVHVLEMDALRAWAPYITTAMGYNLDPNALDPSRGNMPRVSLNTASPLLTLPPFPAQPSQFRSYATDYPYATDVVNPASPALAPVHAPTLWLGFYNAMLPALEPPYTDAQLFVNLSYQPPTAISSTNFFEVGGVSTQQRQLAQQFRSSLRDPSGIGPYIPNRPGGNVSTDADATTWLSPASELLLRSLIASVNAQDIRDSDDDVSSATFFGLPVMSHSAPLNGGAKVTAFGTERQPFITEIYVNNDTTQQPANFQGPNGSGVNIPNNVSAGDTNPLPYVAVELYNPYDVDIPLTGYVLAAMSRTTATYPAMTLRQISNATTFTGSPIPTVPKHGFLVLESVDVAHDPTRKTYRPWWVYPGTTVANDAGKALQDRTSSNYCYVSGLDTVLTDPSTGNADELYLLKPRLANGPTLQSAQVGSFQPGAFFNETTNLADMVPVDSFDFFGMNKSPDGSTFQAWHYVRANTVWADRASTSPRPSWKFVFAGHWEPGQVPAVILGTTTQQNPTPAPSAVREDGVQTDGSWTTGGFDQWIATPPGWTGAVNANAPQPPDGPTAPINIGSADFASSYLNPYPGIPLNNTGTGVSTEQTGHGINKNLSSNAFDSYPFGGFARNGDLLQVPFIGGYTITNPSTGAIIEMNPVTKDAGFADDNNINYVLNIAPNAPAPNPSKIAVGPLVDGRTAVDGAVLNEDNEEQLGRFVPLSSADGDPNNFLPVYSMGDPTQAWFPPGASVGYSLRLTNGATTDPRLFDTYGWAAKIFDYFSALQTPNDDYLPNTKQEYYFPYNIPNPNTGIGEGYTSSATWKTSFPVANSPTGASSPNGSAEATTPIEGLININTAPWKVLAQVPFYSLNPQNTSQTPPGQTSNLQMMTANIEIAQAIVRYRNEFGPFRSIFDLNRVIDPYLVLSSPPYNPTLQIVQCQGQTAPQTGPPDTTDYMAYQGVLTPSLPGFLNDGYTSTDPNHLPDGLYTDFNQREAEVMKLSNLLTTRSDSFTVYLQVQGWRGAGTPSAQLVVQRRAAFIMDRSGSTRSADNKSNTTNQISVNIPTKIQTE